MLDSLVRVSRRVLRVPKAVASLTGIGLPREEDVRRPVEGEPYFNQQRARTGDGAKSVPPSTVTRACDGLDAHQSAA